MKTIKSHLGKLLAGCVLACCLMSNTHAQSQPVLSILKTSPTAVLVNWTNRIGTSYHVWFTTNLAAPFSLLEDAFSPDPMVSVYASTAYTSPGFFWIEIPTNGAAASAQILSPPNAQIVSGEITVRMGAQLGTQIQGVNLYLDGALVGYLNSGGMGFHLDTTHFANGEHTLYVGAVDTANNETTSSPITLDFENNVRWLDACSMFNYDVPIDVTADFYPADWLVTGTDTNGMIVRTISGSTSDGNISTSWDGTDDYGQPLPVESLYEITVDMSESSGPSSMTSPSSLAGALGASSVSVTTNPHGVPEYTVQKPAPTTLTAYLNTLTVYSQLSPQERLIYPPLPPPPVSNPSATTTIKMSARDVFLAIHKASSNTLGATSETATPDAGSPIRSGSTKTLAWWENPWSSGQIEVARVPIPGAFGTTVANDCNQIAELISEAALTVGDNRDVFGGFVQVVQTSSDLAGVTNDLANSRVTAFYYYGHGTTNGDAFGTTSFVVAAKDLAGMFGNHYYSALGPGYAPYGLAGEPGLLTHKPFNLVFLDGCNTALGDLPEAFGITKHISGAALNEAGLHRRAFMGWSGPVTFQFDSSHIDWSLKFWSDWLGSSYSTTLTHAINAAYTSDPSVLNNVPIRWYGNGSLTWSE
jgi:Bacterial Ig domain